MGAIRSLHFRMNSILSLPSLTTCSFTTFRPIFTLPNPTRFTLLPSLQSLPQTLILRCDSPCSKADASRAAASFGSSTGFAAAKCCSSVPSTETFEVKEEASAKQELRPSIPVRAFFFSTSVDLRSLVEQNKPNFIPPTSRMTNYVVLRFGNLKTEINGLHPSLCGSENCFMVVFQYGSIVLFNVREHEIDGYLKLVERHASGLLREMRKDEYEVKEEPNLVTWMQGGLDYIMLQYLSIDGIRTIGSVLGQSIALDYYVRQVDGIVAEFTDINRGMEKTGTFKMERKKLFQLVGKANSNLADVILKLGLFERSDIAWKDAKYAQIWEYLRDEFELTQRFASLDFKLKFVEHNIRFLQEILQNRKSDFLEWLIIILIGAEILISVYDIAHKLASIYYLQSGCQGSGKKRFVTVIRTERTCMPSSSGRIRLEKLIGVADEDTDFTLNDIALITGDRKLAKRGSKRFGHGSAPKKSFKNSADRTGTKEVRRNKKEDKHSYAAQPMSFVSSGVMHSETEIKTLNMTDTDNTCQDKKDVARSSSYGAFELHTTGFGSKMMAKMGYVEGEGLGKDRQGRAEVIEVVQRPKSLGLGANVLETSMASSVKANQPPKKPNGPGAKGPKTRSKMPEKESGQFAAFEKHTKGFGSKLMAKMGFVEGSGLGRDSQGIVNPLVASRMPKSRGLGAKG